MVRSNSAEDEILPQTAKRRGSTPQQKKQSTQLPPLARTRGNSRVRTSLSTPKNAQDDACAFFGAEDEIRTRATVSHTTPLAGEPLEPLGYFCIAHLFKSYTTISHFSALVKAFFTKKEKTFGKFFKKIAQENQKKVFRAPIQTLDGFFIMSYNKTMKK